MSSVTSKQPPVAGWLDLVFPIRMLGRLRPAARVGVIVAAIVFAGGLAAAIALLNGASRGAATRAAHSFNAALVRDDASLAPPGAAPYISAIRARFGHVAGARFLEAHNHAAGHGDDAHTYYQADVLLSTRRGPVALQLSFDNNSIKGERVTSVDELSPAATPKLTAAERGSLQRAFRARGGHALTATALLAGAPVVTQAAPTVVHPRRPHVAAPAALTCVKKAHGDVAKLAACTA
jgi:hypothetical protein